MADRVNVRDTGGYSSALNDLGNIFHQRGWTPTAQNQQTYATTLQDLGNQFQGLFESLVGRAPTVDEVNTFYQQHIIPHGAEITDPNRSGAFQQNLGDYVASNYQGAAKDYATQQLQQQVGQAQTLADQFRAQGNQAINSTESALLDYQQRLFDKLRPNLITSLAAQGLLDTGGLNQAVAGAQGDLANNAQDFLMQQRLANEQNANQIAFAGASAPLAYQQSLAMNQLPYLQAQGQNYQNQAYNTFLTNLNYQNQSKLMHQQAQEQQGLQPSFLRTFGQTAAQSLGSNFNVPQWISAANSGKNLGALA